MPSTGRLATAPAHHACSWEVYRVRRAGAERKAFGWAVMPCGVSELTRGIERWAGDLRVCPAVLACSPASTCSTLPARQPARLWVVPFWVVCRAEAA